MTFLKKILQFFYGIKPIKIDPINLNSIDIRPYKRSNDTIQEDIMNNITGYY